MAEIIEGESVEVEPRAIVVSQPGNALVARPQDSGADMIAHATQLATALKDIVERQKLYTVISGKKFPQVEAWMTIGRMDNVVAREAERPIRNEDGSYEGFVELVRLSDGMVIGRASALCGTADDRPWDKRGEPARRSMAVTRATSRAFRQQYSWIMALAGYQPTPAEEMVDDRAPEPVTPASVNAQETARLAAVKPVPTNGDGSLIGTVEIAKDSPDFLPHVGPDGAVLTFKLVSPAGGIKVIATGPLAEVLSLSKDSVVGQRVSCWGRVRDSEPWTPKGSKKPIVYQVLDLERIKGPDFILPAPEDIGPVPPPDIELAGEADDFGLLVG